MTQPRVIAFGLRDLHGVEGGIETHARELYRRLVPLGYRVTVLTRARYGTAGRAGAVEGTAVKRMWAPRGRGLETFVHSLLCTAYCAYARPDLVHVHGIGPAFFAACLRAIGLRVVVTHHGHDYNAAKWGRLARWLLRTAERIAVRRAHAVICVSESIRRQIERAQPIVCDSIYNGAPGAAADMLVPTGALADLQPGRFVLVVGRITAHKRVLDVVTAMQSPVLRPLRLVVCGSTEGTDPYIDAVRSAAARVRQVVLAGYVEPPQLRWLYAHSACTVMASSYEGMPLAVLEAIAAGATVLLSDIDAHRELGLPPEHYFRTADAADLRCRLEALVRSPRHARGTGVLDSRFDWSHIAVQTAAVFDRAMNARANRLPGQLSAP